MTQSNKSNLQELFIGIAGLIGAGKSTLATSLEIMWASPSITSQSKTMNILQTFTKTLQNMRFKCRSSSQPKISTAPRIIWRVEVLYKIVLSMKTLPLQKAVNLGLTDDRDYRTYLDLFKHMSTHVSPQHYCILDIKPEIAKRIGMRAWKCRNWNHIRVP